MRALQHSGEGRAARPRESQARRHRAEPAHPDHAAERVGGDGGQDQVKDDVHLIGAHRLEQKRHWPAG